MLCSRPAAVDQQHVSVPRPSGLWSARRTPDPPIPRSGRPKSPAPRSTSPRSATAPPPQRGTYRPPTRTARLPSIVKLLRQPADRRRLAGAVDPHDQHDMWFRAGSSSTGFATGSRIAAISSASACPISSSVTSLPNRERRNAAMTRAAASTPRSADISNLPVPPRFVVQPALLEHRRHVSVIFEVLRAAPFSRLKKPPSAIRPPPPAARRRACRSPARITCPGAVAARDAPVRNVRLTGLAALGQDRNDLLLLAREKAGRRPGRRSAAERRGRGGRASAPTGMRAAGVPGRSQYGKTCRNGSAFASTKSSVS